MVRGIEKRAIFLDDSDRNFFVQRLSTLLEETETQCLAWSMMSNHLHLLVRPTRETLACFMRRLLTGYAVTFNQRHRRTGYLFQNRYKSIVCEEDPYLLELVRYIHLNPLRAGLVADVQALDGYLWTGHAVLMGNRLLPGQNVAEVLAYFGEVTAAARDGYRRFITDGASQGRRKELVGGGLKRVQKAGVDGEPACYDARVLGSGTFVKNLLAEQEICAPTTPMISLPALINRVAVAFGLQPKEIRAPGRTKRVADARSIISYLAYRKLGYSGDTVAQEIGITRSGVCRRAVFGEQLVRNDRKLQAFLNN